MPTWIEGEGENGNRASVERWGTEEAAQGLENCEKTNAAASTRN